MWGEAVPAAGRVQGAGLGAASAPLRRALATARHRHGAASAPFRRRHGAVTRRLGAATAPPYVGVGGGLKKELLLWRGSGLPAKKRRAWLTTTPTRGCSCCAKPNPTRPPVLRLPSPTRGPIWRFL